VFTTCTDASLRSGRARIRAFILPKKDIFELYHPRVGKQQLGILGDERTAGHNGVSFGLKEIEESLTNHGTLHGERFL
jgi:hypothetical protein